MDQKENQSNDVSAASSTLRPITDRELAQILEMGKRENRIYNEEADLRSLGDFKVRDVKGLIRETIRHEMWHGDLPFLNRRRKETAGRIALAVLVAMGVGLMLYFLLSKETGYSAKICRDKITLHRSIGYSKYDYVITARNGQWYVCPQASSSSGCSEIFTPLDIPFTEKTQLTFVRNGQVYWTNKDHMGVRNMKFEDGKWLFEDEYSDSGWLDFDSYFEEGYPGQQEVIDRSRGCA